MPLVIILSLRFLGLLKMLTKLLTKLVELFGSVARSRHLSLKAVVRDGNVDIKVRVVAVQCSKGTNTN